MKVQTIITLEGQQDEAMPHEVFAAEVAWADEENGRLTLPEEVRLRLPAELQATLPLGLHVGVYVLLAGFDLAGQDLDLSEPVTVNAGVIAEAQPATIAKTDEEHARHYAETLKKMSTGTLDV